MFEYYLLGTLVSKSTSKRKLDMGGPSTVKGSENELWNDTHITLVQDLEKRGILWRYSSKHLKVWTDCIISGNSGGVNEVGRSHRSCIISTQKGKNPGFKAGNYP